MSAPAYEGGTVLAPHDTLVRPQAWQGLGGLRSAVMAAVRPVAVPLSLTAIAAAGAAVRLYNLNAVGYNSDEAVYAGQAASLAGNPAYVHTFPVFRAHPLLFQTLLAPFYRHGSGDLAGRLVSVAIGIITIFVCYAVATRLYGRWTGVAAAMLLAVMPYHVVVSRQVLLDGPATLLATLTLLVFVRYLQSRRLSWMIATGALFGLSLLAKETNVLFLGSMYVTIALLIGFRRAMPAIIGATVAAVVAFASYPLALALGGHEKTGHNYLVWQLMRRANHSFWFYETNLPWAIGPLLLILAVAGLWLLRRQASWREVVLLSWIVVPLLALQIWPVKGFQYLLPTAPAIAILAGRLLSRIGQVLPDSLRRGRWAWQAAAVVAVVASLVVPTINRVATRNSATFLAGSGGLPAGREAGQWLSSHVPQGAVLLTIGPSMANVLEYYGHRQAYALSISPNPLHRNPSYTAVTNPDRAVRDDDIQYVVWDAYSASRTQHFAAALLRIAHRYHGRVIHAQEIVTHGVPTAVIVIYAVRP